MPNNSNLLATIQAKSAASFIDSIGVNAHIDSGLPNWSNTSLIEQEMSYLGVENMRDGTPYDWTIPEYTALARMGIKFDLTQENPIPAPLTTINASFDTQRADVLEEAMPGSILSLEGANEYNINSYDLGTASSYGNIAWGALDDAQLQTAVAADPLLSGVKVIAASTSGALNLPNIGQYVSASNWHVYAGVGQQLAANMASGIAEAQQSAPGLPVYITEAGISSSGYGSSFWGVADQYTQGLVDLNAVLDGYSDGAAKTFLYDLMDDTVMPSAQENDFGLFNIDGTPKPAATDISNLVHLLADSGTSPVTPGSLSYSISGLPSTASSMLLEKSNNSFDLVVWNGNATLSNGVADVAPPQSTVTVTFAQPELSISTYDPVAGLTALQTGTNTSSTSFSLGADPIILAVSPQPTVAPADTLTLQVSEDAWLGNAQFRVAVDGQAVGGVYTATASHALGQIQTLSLSGNWGPGAHVVDISFINDAYGGSSSMDRNLYVDGVNYDGRTSTPNAAPLYRNGTSIFTVPAASSLPAAGNLSVLLAEDSYKGNACYTVAVDGQQIGGVGTVSALNSSGHVQLADLINALAPGVHDVAVSFINDLYGGNSSEDRNLYVKGFEVNGNEIGGASATLLQNGTDHFMITVPAG